VSVVGIAGATDVAVGGRHTCAVLAGGTVSCWGYNNVGQLGDGTTTSSAVPVPVTGMAQATSLAGGDYHTCAMGTSGAVSCWGSNESGQLGDRTFRGSTTPVSAFGVTAASSLTTGGTSGTRFFHSCAALADGTVSCWGDDHFAQAGNVTPLTYTTPEPVLGLP
jgi:alpha-tubulin suppressor-like RCC1 family protein